MMRGFKTAFGISMMLLIGLLREKYVFNLFNLELPFLIPRSAAALNLSYKVESVLESLVRDPRWASTLVLFLLMEGLTAFTLLAYFQKKYVVIVSLLLSGVLGGLAGLFVLLGIAFNSYEWGYKSAINVMYLLQLPFILLVLFPVFYYIEKRKKAKDTPIASASGAK